MVARNFITRPGSSSLADFVSITDFGADPTGVADSKPAIQAALNTGKSVLIPNGTFLVLTTLGFTAAGQKLYGLGNKSVILDDTGAQNFINSNGHDNLTVSDLKVDANLSSAAGIAIGSGSRNFTVDNVYFYQGGQRVWLFACDTVKVTNCTFEETGYGVIQQTGFSSSDVLVANNTAINVGNDFVEANCASAPSFNWVISNNVYEGCSGWPTPATESRFVGITGVNGVVISGNTAKRVCGDAAVHLEDIGGEIVISNNYFVDVLGTGYIYILNNAENCVITGNILEHRDATINPAPAVWCINNYTPEITFVGNRVKGISANKVFDAFAVGFFYGDLNISGNTFDTCRAVLDNPALQNVSFTNNRLIACTNPLVKTGGTSAAFRNFLIANNVFTGTTGTHDINLSHNTSGTGAPKRCFVTGNKFGKNVSISGHLGHPVAGDGDAEDITVINNVFASGATLSSGGTMSRRRYSGNVFESTGEYDLDFDDATADSLTVTTATITNLTATNLGTFQGNVNFQPLTNLIGWESFQGGIHLDGVEADYTGLGPSINKTITGSRHLYIGTGFILPQNYTGTVSVSTGFISGGLFYIELESSPDHITWTTDASTSTSSTTFTHTYTSIAQPLALRVRLRNSNGTPGSTTLSSITIPNLPVQQIIQACGGPKANYSTLVSFPVIGTTASAANAFLDNTSSPANRLLLSTSSRRYKTEIEDLEHARADAILGLRPVWYRSLAEADPNEWSYYGLIAEEVAEVEPRLVSWTYPEDAYETVEVTEEIDEEEVTYTTTRLKEGISKIPNGVQYERLGVLLLDIIKRQEERIAALEKKLNTSS